MKIWMMAAALAGLAGPAGAQEGQKPKDKGHGDCKKECQEQIRALRENFHRTVEQMRREMEAQVEAIRRTCKHGGGEAGGDPSVKPPKQGPGGKCDCCCRQHCGHSESTSSPSGKGNNGVGNGLDPQPPGNPPLNDGPGSGAGDPGNKGKGAPPGKGKGADDRGKGADDKGKGPEDREKGGPPAGKGKEKGGT
jgi:hypothetical protein